MSTDRIQIDDQIKQVKAAMATCLENTKLAPVVTPKSSIMGRGKMLRARLALTMGQANGVDEQASIYAAAAVEVIHGASLLHDDVIDGGLLRRGAPTFWKKHGVNGAILLGDMLVFKALNLVVGTGRDDLLKELINMSEYVCRSEVEQELILRGSPGTWRECEQIARAKTGSLFAFAAVVGTDGSSKQTEALREAGFLLGTAYQLADDVLDASGNEELSGKTLGKDAERGKTTALNLSSDQSTDPIQRINALISSSSELLAAWPVLQQGWDAFLNVTMRPVLDKHLSAGEAVR